MGKFKTEKEIIYQIKLEKQYEDAVIDNNYQLRIREMMKTKTVDMEEVNSMIKEDVKAIIRLYQTGSLNFQDMYNKMIKIIGYNFMIEELDNRKSDEQLIEEGEEPHEKTVLEKLVEEGNKKYND